MGTGIIFHEKPKPIRMNKMIYTVFDYKTNVPVGVPPNGVPADPETSITNPMLKGGVFPARVSPPLTHVSVVTATCPVVKVSC